MDFRSPNRLAAAQAVVSLVVIAGAAAGCGGASTSSEYVAAAPALVGVEPVPRVHLFENHSSALIAWRREGVRERILVHLDGHADMDWLPDETVARIAAARPDELSELELHPYALDDSVHARFGIWNFVYPAARLGIVSEFWWVVPDGTLEDADAARRLVKEVLVDKMEMISVDEAAGLHFEGRRVRGQVLGVPMVLCELADLPAFQDPVLLDIDIDYFTTRSAITMYVTTRPWISPDELLEILSEKGVKTDLVTMSLSTIGGYMPPANRWIGRYLQARLREPSRGPDPTETLRRGVDSGLATTGESPVERFRALVDMAPDDASAWYGLGSALREAGREDEALEARRRAVDLDPLLEHDSLFLADRLWLNGDWEEAVAGYRSYLDDHPDTRFRPYVLRRIAGTLMRLRRDDEAIPIFEEVVRLAPAHGDSLLDLGILYRDRNEFGRAIGYLGRARRALPDRATYAMALGTTYLMAGRFEEAAAELRVAVERRPCWVRARRNLAVVLIQLGHPAEAAPHLQIAMNLEPDNSQVRVLASQLENSSGIRFVDGP